MFSALFIVYKSETKAKRYFTVVGLFFNYIRKTADIVNPELYDAISFNRLRKNSYMKRMMAYIEKCDLLAAIGIKMMMFYGITCRELSKIKWENCDEYYGFITVNGFELCLPPKLTRQLQQVQKFVFQNKVKSNDGLLFVDGNGEPWGEITTSQGVLE